MPTTRGWRLSGSRHRRMPKPRGTLTSTSKNRCSTLRAPMVASRWRLRLTRVGSRGKIPCSILRSTIDPHPSWGRRSSPWSEYRRMVCHRGLQDFLGPNSGDKGVLRARLAHMWAKPMIPDRKLRDQTCRKPRLRSLTEAKNSWRSRLFCMAPPSSLSYPITQRGPILRPSWSRMRLMRWLSIS